MSISDIPPGLFTLVAETLGIYIAKNLRLNDQNSIGNFIELLGQVILSYSAQQQLRQQGPGTHPSQGINYEFARLAAAIPLSLIIDELPDDLLQDPVIQQKLAQESVASNGQTQGSQASNSPQTSSSTVPITDSDTINTMQSRIESLESKIQQLQKQVEALTEYKPNQ